MEISSTVVSWKSTNRHTFQKSGVKKLEVVTTVLGQVVTTVTTFGRLAPMTQPASCVLTITERAKLI